MNAIATQINGESPADAKSMRILYIEEDLEDQDIFKDAIKQIDSEAIVLPCRTGNEAFHLLDDIVVLPDVIFSEINSHTGGVVGREIVVRLKNDARLKAIPLIIYTNSSYSHDEAACKKAGADKYLVKPASFAEVVHVLKQVVISCKTQDQ